MLFVLDAETGQKKIGLLKNPIFSQEAYKNKPSQKAHKDILEASALGIIETDEATLYHENMNRDEFVKALMFFLAAQYGCNYDEFVKTASEDIAVLPNEKVLDYKQRVFEDANESHVNLAAAFGVVQGKTSSNFDPDGFVTRQEAATMLNRLYSVYRNSASETIKKRIHVDYFQDYHRMSDWAIDSVNYMSELKVIKGFSENRFNPNGNLTKEQCYTMLLKLYKYAPSSRYNNNVIDLDGLQ